MDYPLTEEQLLLVDSVRAFREKELEPHEAEVDRAGEVPEALGSHIKQKAIEMGFYAPNLPESIGGGGWITNLWRCLKENWERQFTGCTATCIVRGH